MKQKFLITILLFLFIGLTNIHAQNCNSPIGQVDFLKIFSLVSSKQNDQLKLGTCNTWFVNKCFTSDQIKQLAALFTTDDFRFQFATTAFSHCWDQGNYYSVMDAFYSYSYAFRLYDFMTHPTIIDTNPPVPVFSFPNYSYPSSVGYSGMVSCNLPITDNDFLVLVQPIIGLSTDAEKNVAALQLTQTQCLSMAEDMMLASLFTLELNKLNFMKEAFLHAYDMENYTFASQLFTTTLYKTDWTTYCQNQLTLISTPPPPPLPVCTVSETDMINFKKAISKESFSDTKLKMAKQILSNNPCFTVLQARDFVNLLSFDGDKLDLAKYAWDFTIDHQNYYLMNDAFSFSSTKNDLMDFVNSKK